MTFQRHLVRSSTKLYFRFNLAMGRSHGFGSATDNLSALLRLAFAAAPDQKSLTLLPIATRWPVLQKVRGHPALNFIDQVLFPHLINKIECWAPTACKQRVSGSVSLPSRGSFHLSLTVLFAIGHWVVFSLGGWSPHVPTGFLVSGGTLEHSRFGSQFRLRGCYPL